MVPASEEQWKDALARLSTAGDAKQQCVMPVSVAAVVVSGRYRLTMVQTEVPMEIEYQCEKKSDHSKLYVIRKMLIGPSGSRIRQEIVTKDLTREEALAACVAWNRQEKLKNRG